MNTQDQLNQLSRQVRWLKACCISMAAVLEMLDEAGKPVYTLRR